MAARTMCRTVYIWQWTDWCVKHKRTLCTWMQQGKTKLVYCMMHVEHERDQQTNGCVKRHWYLLYETMSQSFGRIIYMHRNWWMARQYVNFLHMKTISKTASDVRVLDWKHESMILYSVNRSPDIRLLFSNHCKSQQAFQKYCCQTAKWLESSKYRSGGLNTSLHLTITSRIAGRLKVYGPEKDYY